MPQPLKVLARKLGVDDKAASPPTVAETLRKPRDEERASLWTQVSAPSMTDTPAEHRAEGAALTRRGSLQARKQARDQLQKASDATLEQRNTRRELAQLGAWRTSQGQPQQRQSSQRVVRSRSVPSRSRTVENRQRAAPQTQRERRILAADPVKAMKRAAARARSATKLRSRAERDERAVRRYRMSVHGTKGNRALFSHPSHLHFSEGTPHASPNRRLTTRSVPYIQRSRSLPRSGPRPKQKRATQPATAELWKAVMQPPPTPPGPAGNVLALPSAPKGSESCGTYTRERSVTPPRPGATARPDPAQTALTEPPAVPGSSNTAAQQDIDLSSPTPPPLLGSQEGPGPLQAQQPRRLPIRTATPTAQPPADTHKQLERVRRKSELYQTVDLRKVFKCCNPDVVRAAQHSSDSLSSSDTASSQASSSTLLEQASAAS